MTKYCRVNHFKTLRIDGDAWWFDHHTVEWSDYIGAVAARQLSEQVGYVVGWAVERPVDILLFHNIVDVTHDVLEIE